MSSFPLGRAPLVMIALFLFASPFVLLRPHAPAGQLDFWVFAQTHYDEYTKRLPIFEQTHPGVHVRLQLLEGKILRDKLTAAFLSETAAPDLAEIEISDISRYFQGRREDIGFEDITDRLNGEGWMQRMIPARFVPWTNRGRIYGLPHDLHPVVMFYRDDLFRQAGVDLPREAQTWDDYFKVLERPGVLDSRKDGNRDRYGIMLHASDQGQYRLLLQQRGGDFFDAKENVTFDSSLSVDTLRWYRQLFTKNHVVFSQPLTYGPDMYGPMKEDRLLSVLAPDWFIGMIKKFTPELAGKWRAMPMPAWEPGGRRTSTMGGTMTAMTRLAKNKPLCWELLKFLSLNRDALVNRYDQTRILPPLRDAWSAPIFHEPDPYTGGEKLGELFVQLAPQVPPVYQGKYLAEANDLIKPVVYQSIAQGADPAPLLRKAADRIRERIAHDHFVQ